VTKLNDSHNAEEGINHDILRLLFDSSPQRVIDIHDGKIIYTNSALASSVGVTPE
jgi:PAS domain-containing protein